MRCDFSLCVYWEENQCRLDSIQINELGLCDDCILVDLEEELLSTRRAAYFAGRQGDE